MAQSTNGAPSRCTANSSDPPCSSTRRSRSDGPSLDAGPATVVPTDRRLGAAGPPPLAASTSSRWTAATLPRQRGGLPAGLIWGEAPGEIIFHPDEAVTGVIAAVFGQFAALGSARAAWLWLGEQNLRWPLQQATTVSRGLPEITWVEPTYKAVLAALRHPAYAGAYVYGRTRAERYVDEQGRLRTRRRDLPPDQWEVLIPGHHDGFIDWDAYQDIQRRLDGNIPPAKGAPGTGAVREGSAHLQALATCGICGRKAAVYYDGEHKATPGYYCTGGSPGASRGHWHLRVGGAAIDAAVTGAFLAALAPAALQACLAAAGQLEAGYDSLLRSSLP